jgi:peptidoglycan/xylan/chitin deacetylase (PgdA/CDA1 family)
MTQPPPIAPLGVCIWETPVAAHYLAAYGHYCDEILGHAGVCYASIPPAALPAALAESLPALRILLTVGETELPPALQAQLAAWVEAGGAWISVGGVCGLARLFGVAVEPPAYRLYGFASNLGEGYLEPRRAAHAALGHVTCPLHFFNGISVLPAEACEGVDVLAGVLDAHQRPTRRLGVVERRVGLGRCLLIAPDLTGTVVRIQQGTAITRDGVAAPDGAGPICDGILKSDDGLALDWLFDRQPVAGAAGLSAFMQPIADLWRELLLRAIFHLARAQKVVLPLLWLYPRSLPALAELSHDTDLNDPPLAVRLLDVLAQADVRSTWCVLLPGYPPEVIAAIRAAGHELAMHYDSFSVDRPWSEANFVGQREALAEMFGGQPPGPGSAAAPITNKNHYLRWEGDSDLWRWCVRAGIQLDQSKGPSKTGAIAFVFGTCHPYFPLDPAGRFLDVLELPTLTQDMLLTSPMAALAPMLDGVLQSHGVLHLLFHPAHIAKPGQADALLESVARGRAAGLEWWTAAQINGWERARRQAGWRTLPGGVFVLRTGAAPLPGATLLWLAPDGSRATLNAAACAPQIVERWGFSFHAATVDAAADSEQRLEVL